jgi:hypothetical protein
MRAYFMRRRRWFKRSMRVINPRKVSPSNDGLQAGHHGAFHRVPEPFLVAEHGQEDVAFVDDPDHPVVPVEHRHLGDVVELHAAVGGQERVPGRNGDRGVLLVAPGDQVPQVAPARPFDQALIDHPEVVVHLGEVFVAAVADEANHPLGRGLLPAVAERGGNQGARGRARQDPLFGQEVARRHQGLPVAHRIGSLDRLQIRHRRQEVLADALHQPGAHLGGQLAGPHVARQYGALRVGQHHLDLRRDPGEEPGEPGDGAAGADAANHRVQVVVHLLPELGSRRGLVGQGIGRIGELIDVERIRDLLGQALGVVLVILRMALAHVRTR